MAEAISDPGGYVLGSVFVVMVYTEKIASNNRSAVVHRRIRVNVDMPFSTFEDAYEIYEFGSLLVNVFMRNLDDIDLVILGVGEDSSLFTEATFMVYAPTMSSLKTICDTVIAHTEITFKGVTSKFYDQFAVDCDLYGDPPRYIECKCLIPKECNANTRGRLMGRG